MARPRKTERFIPVHLNLPELLLTEVDLHLLDPVRLKREYGALGSLVEQLLRKWLEERKADAQKISEQH